MRPVGSFVAAQGCSSCSEACGILAPQQGSNSSPLHCKADSSPLARWEVPFFNASFYSSSSLRSHSAVTAAVCVPSDLVTVVPQACAAPSSLTSCIPPGVSSFSRPWKPLGRLVITTSSYVSRQLVTRALLTRCSGSWHGAWGGGVSGLCVLHRGEQIPHKSLPH